MHVLVESSLFPSSSISWTKENDGKVQRQNRVQKARFLAVLAFMFIAGYHILTSDALDPSIEQRKSNLRDPVNPVDNGVKIKVDTSSMQRKVLFTVDNLDGIPGNSGQFTIQIEPTWAPIGSARVIELTSNNFWDGCRFFRVLPNFMAQFGIASNPSLNDKFSTLLDDPVKESNDRGTVSFAISGPNTRSTQLFINTNTGGNKFLDRQGFSPFGKVIDGMDIVDRLYNEYGEGQPDGEGPNQGKIYERGNEYLEKDFPKLSYIVSTTFLN